MARTLKDVVSYFPHSADAATGDTLTVLQSRFGNDGYAFWFKLLEKLASTEGHYLDCRNSQRWQLLLAKTGVDELTGVEIMKLLVEMNAIDKDLWASKLIWCQNLVNNVSEVYKNRRREIPQKPVITKDNAITTGDNAITTDESTHSKVKESKVNNTILPDFINKEIWEDFLEARKKKRAAPTPHAVVLLIKKLEEFHNAGDDANEVLKRSIMNGWTGIFSLDKKGDQGGTHRRGAQKLPSRAGYTKPRTNPKLAKLVEQQRATDHGPGCDESG